MAAIWYRLRCCLRPGWMVACCLALVVAVLGGVVLTLVAGTVRTARAPDRYVAAQEGHYDATIEQSNGKPRTGEVRALPAVARARSATFVFGQVVPAGENPQRGLDGLVFAGHEAAVGKRLVEGRDPDPRTPGEFVASRSLVEASGISIGDRFDLWVIPEASAAARGFDAADEAVKLLTATLVGVIDGPSADQYALVIFPKSLLAAGHMGVSTSEIAVSLKRGWTVHDLRAELDALPDGAVFGIGPADWVPSEVRTAVRAQSEGFAVLAAIAAVATIIVLGQLLSRQVRVADTDRVVLRSLGLTRAQTVADPVFRAAVPVVAGLSLAVGLAYAASGIFPVGFAHQVEPDPGRRFESVPLFVGALVLGGLVIGWVIVAMIVAGWERPGRRPSWVDSLARHVPIEVASGLRFAFTRQARDATRPRAAVLGAVVVTAMMVGAITFGVSVDHLVDQPGRWGTNFDLGVGQGGDAIPRDAIARLGDDHDVTAVNLYATMVASAHGEGFDVIGTRAVRGSITPHLFAGRVAIRSDEIVIGKVAANRLGIGIGDHLALSGPVGRRRYRVTGIAVLPSVEGADGVGEGGLVTFGGLHRLDPSAAPTAAGLRVRPRASPTAVAKRLSRATGMAIGPGFSTPAVIVNVDRVRAVPYLVAAVLGALALMNLVHQLIVSTRRRRRDLAVLRALGADNRCISSVVRWHASLFTLAVVGIATPIGVIAGRQLYLAFADHLGAVDTSTVPLLLLLVTSVALLAIANIVAIPSTYRARHQPPSTFLTGE